MGSPVFPEFSTGKKGVYFCTVDTDSNIGSLVFGSKIQPGNNALADYYYGEIAVKRKDGFAHSNIRHCWNMLGTEHTTNITGASVGQQALLNVHASQGFYPTGESMTMDGITGYRGHLQDEGFWLFDRKIINEFTVSCTPVLQEGMSNFRRSNPDAIASVDGVDDFWLQTYNKVYKHVRLHPIHNISENNCCRAAFVGGLRAVRDDSALDFNPNLSDIKKRRFNICGSGIPFDAQDDTKLEYSAGVSRTLFDAFLIIPKVVKKKISSLLPSPSPTREL
jgi:hypothetical protein